MCYGHDACQNGQILWGAQCTDADFKVYLQTTTQAQCFSLFEPEGHVYCVQKMEKSPELFTAIFSDGL